jgi:hypothetical protein
VSLDIIKTRVALSLPKASLQAGLVARSTHVAQLKAKLLTLHPGRFQDETYLARWCSESIARLLLDHGVLFQPTPEQRVYFPGEYGPYQCKRNALHKATIEEGVEAWFGFALYWEDGLKDWLWWIHSWCFAKGLRLEARKLACMTDDGMILDPAVPPLTGPDQPAIFFGIPWGLEVYRCLSPDFPVERLPPVLSRSIFAVLSRSMYPILRSSREP